MNWCWKVNNYIGIQWEGLWTKSEGNRHHWCWRCIRCRDLITTSNWPFLAPGIAFGTQLLSLVVSIFKLCHCICCKCSLYYLKDYFTILSLVLNLVFVMIFLSPLKIICIQVDVCIILSSTILTLIEVYDGALWNEDTTSF